MALKNRRISDKFNVAIRAYLYEIGTFDGLRMLMSMSSLLNPTADISHDAGVPAGICLTTSPTIRTLLESMFNSSFGPPSPDLFVLSSTRITTFDVRRLRLDFQTHTQAEANHCRKPRQPRYASLVGSGRNLGHLPGTLADDDVEITCLPI